ncbi:MAG: hypothetical protein ACK4PI_07390 [Tepidisphaerales bacterium]
MSAYIQLATPMTSLECLLDALADLGYDRTKVEVHPRPGSAVGSEQGAAPRQADVIIRRQHLTSGLNDIVFHSTPTGFQVNASSADMVRFGRRLLADLTQRYEYHEQEQRKRQTEAQRRAEEEQRLRLVEATRQSVIEKARSSGYRVEERVENGRIRLVLSKRIY